MGDVREVRQIVSFLLYSRYILLDLIQREIENEIKINIKRDKDKEREREKENILSTSMRSASKLYFWKYNFFHYIVDIHATLPLIHSFIILRKSDWLLIDMFPYSFPSQFNLALIYSPSFLQLFLYHALLPPR